MTTATIEVMDLAREMGFEHWLGEDQVKGWYTCLMTGKKFRGEVAKEMLKKQEQAMAEREEEIERQEQEEQMQEQEEADKQKEEAIKKMMEAGDTFGAADTLIPNATLKLTQHVEVKLMEGKPVKMTTIHCEDCGKERQIKVQDAFQVTRCPECQKKHRNKKRAERRRQQRAEAKAATPKAE